MPAPATSMEMGWPVMVEFARSIEVLRVFGNEINVHAGRCMQIPI